MPESTNPVLILGAGVHGAAIARELLLNGVSVVLADAFDIASGATSKSSRLIHGGLRYLEYGDVRLVRESLEERGRNLELARHFVRPLRLFIPVEHQWSGLVRSGINFLGLQRTGWGRWLAGPPRSRGFWPTRLGLAMYDWLARDPDFAASRVTTVGTAGTPRVDARRYRSLLEYSDAQMPYPERLVFALLADAADIAAERGLSFAVRPYAELTWHDDEAIITPPIGDSLSIRPSLIINASGAWGDATLKGLDIAAAPMFGGTKGSHIVTWHAGLIDALQGQAIYAEADDGRLVFILPFGDAVLIGTTDETYHGPPEEATATEAEIEYLLRMVERVLAIRLSPADVTMHYSGVRPLPRSDGGANAAISRDHSLAWHQHGTTPVLTLVGGKLTTWRSFGEDVATDVLAKLERMRIADTRDRSIPGNDPLPDDRPADDALFQQWATETGSTLAEVAALWPLYGTRLVPILVETRTDARTPIADGPWSRETIHWIIEQESVARLADLVERRLLIIFRREITRPMLADLARCFVDVRRLDEANVTTEVEHCVGRLAKYYGRTVI